jgi:mevalonate kinase
VKAESYFSKTKFLLSGEYLVLKGAKALALPLKYGQITQVFRGENSLNLEWLSYEFDNLWFKAVFNKADFSIIETSENASAEFIQKILRAIKRLKPSFSFQNIEKISNRIDFNRFWGLGTSSSLINNLAQMSEIDPFELHFSVSNGSAYDIAAAQLNNAFFYSLKGKKPHFSAVMLKWPFVDKIWFVYSEKKKSSEESVSKFMSIENNEKQISLISELADKLIEASSIIEFGKIIEAHEEIISRVLNTKPLKELLFSDFDGYIKSLGAWGGDFFMAITERPEAYLKNYFNSKAYNTILNYTQIAYEQ